MEEFIGCPTSTDDECDQTSRYKDEYEEIAPLGEGAYGVVNKVRHKVDNQLYAVKIVFDTRDEKALREVENLASCSHPNIVRYYTTWFEDGFEDAASDVSSGSGYSTSADRASVPGTFEEVNAVEKLEKNVADMVLSSRSSRSSLSTDSRCLFIQMELCDSTLKDWINQRYDQPTADGSSSVVSKEINRKILRKMLEALTYIHSKKIIHRDLKPENIFIKMVCGDAQPQVKIGDFGLSRHLAPCTAVTRCTDVIPAQAQPPGIQGDVLPGASGGARSAHAPGMSGDCPPEFTTDVGTKIYAAPELSSSSHDQKADIYSFALIMFEMFKPFGTEMERRITLNQVRDGEIPSDFRAAWPDESVYIEKLLHADRDERPSAEVLLANPMFSSEEEQLMKNLKAQLKSKDDLIKHQQDRLEKDQQSMQNLQAEFKTKDDKIKSLQAEIARLQEKPPNNSACNQVDSVTQM